MRILMIANPGSVHSQRWSAALAARGHDVLLAGIRRPKVLSPKIPGAEIPGVELAIYGPGQPDPQGPILQAAGYAALGLGLARLARHFRPDVVNAHYALTNGVLAALAGLRPRVVNLWGRDAIWDGAGPMPAWRRRLLRIALERADAIVSTTDFMLQSTRPLLRRLPPAHVIRWGVDCAHFTPNPEANPETGPETSPEAGSEAGSGADTEARRDTITVGWVKTFAPKYAPDLFLEAAARAAAADPRLRFVMAGQGPEHAATKTTAQRFGLEDRIVFPGFVPQAELPELMRSVDMLVQSSRYASESYGVVLVEAAACGLPVIATDVGGVREAMLPGENALLVPPEDPEALSAAILALAHDPARRVTMGATGRTFVERELDWQRSLDRHEEVLREVVQALRTRQAP